MYANFVTAARAVAYASHTCFPDWGRVHEDQRVAITSAVANELEKLLDRGEKLWASNVYDVLRYELDTLKITFVGFDALRAARSIVSQITHV